MIAKLMSALVLAACCVACGRRALHYLQLESYQLPGYMKSLRRNPVRAFWPGVAVAAVGGACALAGLPAPIRLPLTAACAVAIYLALRVQGAKKPLVFTERVKRLLLIELLLCIALEAALTAAPLPAILLPALSPLLLALAALCAQPMERRIAKQFMDDARRRLDACPGLIRIGITGSYGKTSTKFLLRDILSVRYNVLATPSSFNTPMGVTRVIREELTGAHQVFIAEMGARHVGDIRELVELVHPTIGLLTSVGPQHLDTFGTIERVRDTKYELIEGLPKDGIAVFARDGAICDELYARCPLERKYRPDDLIAADDPVCGPWGTRFTLRDVQTGETAACETRLLGEHAIANLLLCCTTARALGMTLGEIAAGVARCHAVEHRLELLQGAGGVTIIDDAFNANPAGAQAALRVLSSFPGRRIIVTPGMVELGGEEERFNRAFGEQMADSADVAILVGRRHTQPIADGLTSRGFDPANLHVVGSLQESTALLGTMMRPGDVVLYENDLPDNYAE